MTRPQTPEGVDVLHVLHRLHEEVASEFTGTGERDLTHDGLIAKGEAAIAAVAELVEKAQLVSDLVSTEWQEADGSRRAATDNAGNRLCFVNPELIADLRAALSRMGPQP